MPCLAVLFFPCLLQINLKSKSIMESIAFNFSFLLFLLLLSNMVEGVIEYSEGSFDQPVQYDHVYNITSEQDSGVAEIILHINIMWWMRCKGTDFSSIFVGSNLKRHWKVIFSNKAILQLQEQRWQTQQNYFNTPIESAAMWVRAKWGNFAREADKRLYWARHEQ